MTSNGWRKSIRDIVRLHAENMTGLHLAPRGKRTDWMLGMISFADRSEVCWYDGNPSWSRDIVRISMLPERAVVKQAGCLCADLSRMLGLRKIMVTHRVRRSAWNKVIAEVAAAFAAPANSGPVDEQKVEQK